VKHLNDNFLGEAFEQVALHGLALEGLLVVVLLHFVVGVFILLDRVLFVPRVERLVLIALAFFSILGAVEVLHV
jgi:hypothetical protein